MIRKAEKKDAIRLIELLYQVDMLHHNIRPDLFKKNIPEVDIDKIETIIDDDLNPIFVYDEGIIYGYILCQIIEHRNHHLLQDVKTLSIDNIGVDETVRGQHIGKIL